MRFSNVPIPEPHVAALIAAAAVHAVLPVRIPVSRQAGRITGGILLAAGTAACAAAVVSAEETDLERRDGLVTGGAYALSRNPMYVGWSCGVLGVALWTRSAWLVAAWSVAVRLLDGEIKREESQLLGRFGSSYETYRAQVPRYIVRL